MDVWDEIALPHESSGLWWEMFVEHVICSYLDVSWQDFVLTHDDHMSNLFQIKHPELFVDTNKYSTFCNFTLASIKYFELNLEIKYTSLAYIVLFKLIQLTKTNVLNASWIIFVVFEEIKKDFNLTSSAHFFNGSTPCSWVKLMVWVWTETNSISLGYVVRLNQFIWLKVLANPVYVRTKQVLQWFRCLKVFCKSWQSRALSFQTQRFHSTRPPELQRGP